MFLGDTGQGLMEWVRSILSRDLSFPHIRVLYPTAPLQPYTPLDGQLSNVWFDREKISIQAPENRKSMSNIYKSIKELINNEVAQKIPINRIMVGGFSMGGALAMHIGYHLNRQLAGVFACSSFVNRDSVVYETLQSIRDTGDELLPELHMFHGTNDQLVPLKWGEESYRKLVQFGVKGNFTVLPDTEHELKRQELLSINEFILSKLPP